MSSDFKIFVARNAETGFVNIAEPMAFNSQENTSKPCTWQTAGATYAVQFILKKDEGMALAKSVLQHGASRAAQNTQMGEIKDIHGMKFLEDGRIKFTAKRKAMQNSGQKARDVRFVDGQKSAIEDRTIYKGALVNVQFASAPTKNPSTGNWGMALFLDAVQLIKQGTPQGEDLLEVLPGSSENPMNSLESDLQEMFAGEELL